MTIYRQYLLFDRGLSRPNTFLYLSELETIRCRIRVSSADEVAPVDVHLRFRKRGPAHGMVHCHPIDETTIICEAAELHAELPKLELVLGSIPSEIFNQMMRL